MESRGEKIALMWQNILTFRNWLEKKITKHKKNWDNILLVSIIFSSSCIHHKNGKRVFSKINTINE